MGLLSNNENNEKHRDITTTSPKINDTYKTTMITHKTALQQYMESSGISMIQS